MWITLGLLYFALFVDTVLLCVYVNAIVIPKIENND